MLRLHLPPNFVAAVQRDAVPLRVELDLASPPDAALLPVLALLQRWCGTPQPPKFIQLSRAQLRELTAAAGTQALFVENGQLTWFRHGSLLGEEQSRKPQETNQRAEAVAARPPPPPATGRNRPSSIPLVIDGSEHFLAITLPSREDPNYDEALALLKENGFILEPSNRKWWLRDRHKTLNFLAAHLTTLQKRFDAVLAPNFQKNTAKVRAAEVIAEVASTVGGFSVAVGVKAPGVDEATLRSAMASNRGYVETTSGVFLLDRPRLQKLAAAQRALAGDAGAALVPQKTLHVTPARSAEVQEILEELSPNFEAPETWKQRSAALRNLTTLAPVPLSPTLDALLRPYQRLGVAWLAHLQRNGLGGILADEMGLGKTLQALAVLSCATAVPAPPANDFAMPRGVRAPRPQQNTTNRPAVVVCPASLLENWRREALRFTPALRTFVHHGEHRLTAAAEFADHDLVITSYGTLTRDQTLFAETRFRCVIADEAQHIKNRRSQNAAALRALQADSRFLLTGTPVENSMEDLRSLFEFLLPGYLTRVPPGLKADERAWYDERLRAQTAPYILRRTKRSVAPELPDKIEQVLWCELTPIQAALYRATQERSERELLDLEAAGASETKLKFAALTQLLRLRQICCDPRLVEGTSADAASERRGSETPPDNSDSAKLEAFRELLEEAVDDGHRVLVFSQFTSLLALLREELASREIDHCYLDGSMPARARQEQVDRFQHDTAVPLFLLSLKAGGTGLNLTGADTVVIFDPWWNPAAEAQAMDRAHRIGQKRTVTSYKLIAAGTVEEKVLALQAEKRALLADVFEASDAAAAKLSLTDLRELIKR